MWDNEGSLIDRVITNAWSGTVSNKIGLSLPKQEAANKSSFDISARHLEKWINDLPGANIGETSKQLYTLLKQTNQVTYPYQKRIAFLELLRAPIAHVTHSMKKHFISINLPLPDKNQKIANITKKLYFYMATGYKIALEDALSKKSFFDKPPFALLIQRSMSYMGKNILTSYQSYSQFSNQHWSELHKLFSFSEKKHILHTRVIDKQRIYREETSIIDEYSRILLLSLASPSHLRHGEAGKTYDSLEKWLTDPVIRALTAEDKKQDHFVDNLTCASSPTSLSFSLANGMTDENALRIIESREICQKVEQELQLAIDSNAGNNNAINIKNKNLPSDLLKRLLASWNVSTKRHSPRESKNEKVKITIGLSAAHQLLLQKSQTSDNEKHTNKYNSNSHFSATDIKEKVESPFHTEVEDVWDLVYKPTAITASPEIESEQKAPDLKKYQTDNWIIMNESARGFSLNNRDELHNKVQVGELVSICRQTDGKVIIWIIAVIKWLKFNADESLQMGVEVLNPSCAAVGIRTETCSLQRALMLPALSKQQQPASLITSPGVWKKGDKIAINMQGTEIPARLTNPIQNTSLFAQFQFEFLPDSPLEEDNPSTQNELNMNNTWSFM